MRRRIMRPMSNTMKLAWLGVALCAIPVWGQTATNIPRSIAPPTERTFQASKAEVDAALRALRAAAGGTLPTVDGFVSMPNPGSDSFQRPHYSYDIRVLERPAGSTMVRVTARITVWQVGPNPGTGYAELPSNGRLEGDLLDRLQDFLAQKAPPKTASGVSSSTPPKDPPATAKSPRFTTPRPGATVLPPRSTADGNTDSGGAPQPRDSANYAQALREQAGTLEEILRNQTHPTDLAAVRQAKTPVYSRPSEDAEVLFLADAQDEFQVLNTNSEWVHVQISGLSRGWIRGPALELPNRVVAAPKASAKATPEAASGVAGDVNAKAAPAGAAAGPAFRLAKQEVNTYPGDWAPLRGKPVRIASLLPTGAVASTPGQKWDTAKTMFYRLAARLAAPQKSPAATTVEGVVLVFDSADGGMASATVTSLQEWFAGRITDEAFRGQCSFDPPEAFQ